MKYDHFNVFLNVTEREIDQICERTKNNSE